MHYLKTLSRFLLTLPFIMRSSIAALSILLFLVLYMVGPLARSNPSMFLIPMVLVAWMFKKPGVLLGTVGIILPLWVYFLEREGVSAFYSKLTIPFAIGTSTLLIVGFFISWQRDALELSDTMHKELAVAYEKQQRLSQAREQFVLCVNHELRTPLAAVTGYLELLLEFHAQLDPETRMNFLKNAMYGCGELQLLVNNLMDSLQISNEKEILCVEALSVADVVREVIKYTDPGELQKRCIHLDIPEHLMVQANSQFLRQVLRNLLSNAFKYSPVDTPIVIRALLEDCVAQTTPRPPAVCICVKDAGPGIPPDEISLLFGQFVRLKRDIAGKIRGTGLGLYVSKQLVEAMGGRIWVESTGIPGEGSRFCFTLPHVSPTSNISY